MTNHDEKPDGAALGLPVLFIVDADGEARGAIESALLRRFAPDYRVLAADSSAELSAVAAGATKHKNDN